MTRKLFLFTFIVVLFTALWALPQTPTSTTAGGYYVVTPTSPHVNCLWRIGGPQWETIYTASQNNFLREPGRRFTRDGVEYVLVKFRERVFVPPGVHARVKLEPLPPVVVESPTPKPATTPTPAPAAERRSVAKTLILVLVLVFTLTALTGAWAVLEWVRFSRRRAEKQRRLAEELRLADPIGSGPPMIKGGLARSSVPMNFIVRRIVSSVRQRNSPDCHAAVSV